MVRGRSHVRRSGLGAATDWGQPTAIFRRSWCWDPGHPTPGRRPGAVIFCPGATRAHGLFPVPIRSRIFAREHPAIVCSGWSWNFWGRQIDGTWNNGRPTEPWKRGSARSRPLLACSVRRPKRWIWDERLHRRWKCTASSRARHQALAGSALSPDGWPSGAFGLSS